MLSSSITLTTTARAARVSTNSKGEYPLIAVGGEDKSVHVYPFGDRCRVACLAGHTSAVSAVCFDAEQRRVAAGTEGGSIRVFDLEKEQVVRSFGSNAHKAPITSLDYHHYGEFLFSTSADTHMKVWDIRKKTYIQCYKGVPVSVDVVRSFPDGKLVATGCAQGVIRIYDLTAGKLKCELTRFGGAVTSIGFHPTATMCCASSADGTVAAWELEDDRCVFQSAPALRGMDAAVFTHDALLAVSDRSMTTYACAPGTGEFDRGSGVKASDAPWGVAHDCLFSQKTQELMVADISTLSSAVACCTVPLGPKPQQPTGPKRRYHPDSAAAQKQQQQHSPVPSSGGAVPVPRGGAPPDTAAVAAGGKMAGGKMQASPALHRVAQETSAAGSGGGAQQDAPIPRPSSMLNDIRQRRKEMKLQQQQQQQQQQGGVDESTPHRASGAVHSRPAPSPQAVASPPPHQGQSSPRSSGRPNNGSAVHAHPSGGAVPETPSRGASEDEILDALLKSSATMTSLMTRRFTQTKVVRSFWPADIAKALHHVKLIASDPSGSDVGTLVDFLGSMQHQRMREKITLENLPLLLDAVKTCMEKLQTENSLLTCLRLTRSLNHRFQSKIEEGVRAAAHAGIGVDIALEQRIAKAHRAHQALDDISQLARQYVERRDAVGEEARQFCSETVPMSQKR